MLTLISNGSIVDVYIDGEKRVRAANDIQRSAIEFIVFGRFFGNISGTAQENGFLMANVLFASYDPNIWNDEFIQAIYNNQVLAKALKQVEKSPTPPQGLKTKYNITHMGELILQDPDLWKMWFSKANFDKKIVTLGWKWGE
jgi:hypothetical protein